MKILYSAVRHIVNNRNQKQTKFSMQVGQCNYSDNYYGDQKCVCQKK